MDTLIQTASAVYQAVDLDIGQSWWLQATRAYWNDDRLFYTLSLFLAHTGAFYGLNAFYGLLTRWMGKDIEGLRFQPNKHVGSRLYWECVAYVTAWHLLFAPLLAYVMYPYAAAYYPSMMDDPVPGVVTIVWQCAVSYLVTDGLFYWGHRLLHWGPLYRAIHKQHHRFHVSMGFAAEFAHPVELMLCNVFPVVAGPVYFRFHFVTFVTWIAVAILGTVSGHSGITSPISEEDGFHDFHHSANVGNFGSMPHWDRLMGTDSAWRKYKADRASAGRS